MTLRFQTRLILFCTATFALLLIVFGLASYRLLAQQLDVDATADLDALTAGLHSYLHFDHDVASIVFNENDPEQAAFVRKASRYYQVYKAADGRLIAESPDMALLGVRLTPREVGQRLSTPATRDIQTAFGRYRVSSSSISPESGPLFLLQVAASLDPMDAALDRYLDLLLWRVLPSLLTTILVIWWMARRALGPLSEMVAEARGVTIGSLDRRLETRGTGDQLDDLAIAFNETLASLESAVGDMRQFSSALAHELRTPLAAMRGELELALLKSRSIDEWRAGAASQIEEIDKLTRLVNQLLTLARAESGEIRLAHEVVDLAALAVTVTEQLEPVAQSKNVTLECAAAEPVTVTGDGQWLERLLINLLDNAIKYTPSGGDIRVSVSRMNGRARLDVRDTGPGIPTAALPHVFERFYRVDPARSSKTEGSGLGLSLAKWIVDRHHGRIDVSSAPGQGATFAVQLPSRTRAVS
jgi:heavy metal sensor kinase